MKKTTGVNKIVSKPALRYVVRSLPEKKFKLSWNHEDKESILSIYDYETKQISVATFKNGNNLIFQHLDSSNPKVISVFEEVLGVPLSNKVKTNYKTLYLEMDYHLMELYEYIQANEKVKVKETKAKLILIREKMLQKQTTDN
ncbi:hypothetical protein N0O92_05500 [Alkalihalobacillus sp. MEB130]|uniref:hypothetical protein n=1 Tax=Alkalihalobacillus sp. MEB130 TaxID=2976704 RepID=UPI0028DEE494|nr:hypothetical protein [Alkalihalobacillus sp. MEB130]MDT8859682.1 hypothetical protein [Alkalihalobacillus sp. MEB130]